jgi:hypothetical protein
VHTDLLVAAFPDPSASVKAGHQVGDASLAVPVHGSKLGIGPGDLGARTYGDDQATTGKAVKRRQRVAQGDGMAKRRQSLHSQQFVGLSLGRDGFHCNEGREFKLH